MFLTICLQIISKPLSDCREEVEILMRYGLHPGIVNLKTIYEEAGKVYLVLQLLRGGDLLDYMMVKVRFLFTVLTNLSYGFFSFDRDICLKQNQRQF